MIPHAIKTVIIHLAFCLGILFSQQSSVITVAVIDFEQEGLSELEVQTLTQRFISELEKTAKAINFRFNLIIHDLKNFTKLISELKQKEYNFKIIRHKNKKYAFFKKIFGGFKKN